MPSRKFALEPNGPKRLTASWRGLWKEFTVTLDGNVVGTLPNQKALEQGGEWQLPDGTRLRARLARVALSVELQLSRDGQPLPGSSTDPAELVKGAAWVLYLLAAFNAGIGVVAVAFDVEFLLSFGLGVSSIAAGVVYGVLGLFTFKRSMLALGIGMLLYVVDACLTVSMSMMSMAPGRTPGIGGIFMRVFFIYLMARGLKAMWELKKADAGAPPAMGGA